MKKIAFMFCGGGAQYVGMMEDFYLAIPECKRVFDEADRVLGKDLSNVIFHGSQKELNSTGIMIPSIYTCDIAAEVALSTRGVKANYMLGFSLGEWAALTTSGTISFCDGLSIVQFRANAMVQATPGSGGGMAVILKRSNEYVEELCEKVKDGNVYPANYNYEGQITVSGDEPGLQELERIANIEHIIFKRLPVNVPSHCPLMQSAAEQLEKHLSTVEFDPPKCPIVSNATGLIETNIDIIRRNAIEQLVKPVLFEQSIIRLLMEGVNCFIEVGPGKTLSKFVKKTASKCRIDCEITNVENMDSLNRTVELCCG